MGFAQTKLSYRYGYISETLEALNIEPGTFCEQFNEKMTQKVNHDKARKSTVVSKRRRAQMPSRTVAKVMDYTVRVMDYTKRGRRGKHTKLQLVWTVWFIPMQVLTTVH